MRDREERARVPTRGELTEHATRDAAVPLDHDMHQVMRKPRIEARTVRHVHARSVVPIDLDPIAPLSAPDERHAHGTIMTDLASESG